MMMMMMAVEVWVGVRLVQRERHVRESEKEDGWGRGKVVISQLLINILRLRAFQRNVIN